jgi:hypothetical protein
MNKTTLAVIALAVMTAAATISLYSLVQVANARCVNSTCQFNRQSNTYTGDANGEIRGKTGSDWNQGSSNTATFVRPVPSQ